MSINGTFVNGYSGITRMGDNMSVLADNIANVNTVAFKGAHSTFEEILNSAVEPALQGSGVRLASIDTNFNLGKFEPTSVPTDLAIDGKGFFIVRDDESTYYTRNGQFRLKGSVASADVLDLVSPAGLQVQGYTAGPDGAIDTTAMSGVTVDRISRAKATESIRLAVNLEARGVEESNAPLFESWDGSRTAADGSPDPIDAGAYEYRTSVDVFDDTGGQYQLSIYFDSTDVANQKEFLVTCDPREDRRLIGDTQTRYNEGGSPASRGAGALLYGILQFNTQGDLVNILAYDVPADGDVAPSTATNQIQLGRGEEFYSFAYNFSGAGDNLRATIDFGTQAVPQKIRASGVALLNQPGEAVRYVTSTSRWDEVYDASGNQPAAGDVITFTGTAGDGTAVTYAYTISPASQISDLLANLESLFNCTATVEEGVLTLVDNVKGDSQLAISSITYQDAAGNDPTTSSSLAQVFAPQGHAFETVEQDRYQIAAIHSTSYATP